MKYLPIKMKYLPIQMKYLPVQMKYLPIQIRYLPIQMKAATVSPQVDIMRNLCHRTHCSFINKSKLNKC